MAKRNKDENKFIKIKPFSNTRESLLSVAILNALTLLEADKNPLVKIPTRKELTKVLKVSSNFNTVCKVLDEVNGIRIREVTALEAIGECGIVTINHPIIGYFPAFAYRDKTITEYEYKIINTGLGEDEFIINAQHFYSKITHENDPEAKYYQIFLNTGDKQLSDKPINDCCCESCDHLFYDIEGDKDEHCLYDNTRLENTNGCCNKFANCFKWLKTE